MSSTDPSVHCDCRAKSIRNVRIGAIIIAVCAAIFRQAVFDFGSTGQGVSGVLCGLSFVVYGIATTFDETATFPKPLYTLIAVVGALVAALDASSLL